MTVEVRDSKVVITSEEMYGGAPMDDGTGAVRDLKAIYPETGFPTKTLILGIVEIAPGSHSPLHRHACEEVYYVIAGQGELESNGKRYPLKAGDAAYNAERVPHRVFNTGAEDLRLVVVAGVMLIGLLPDWPTPSPYEILEEPA